MEHEIHSVYSLFWRNAYVAALQAGHQDPAAAADEAFMAFDCRFGETEEVLGAAIGCEQKQSADGTCGLGALAKHADDVATEIYRLKAAELRKAYPLTDPSTEGLPPPAEKSDDEVLG